MVTLRTVAAEKSEQAILGQAIVNAPEVIPLIQEGGLKSADLFREAHRIIWTTMLGLLSEQVAIDVFTIGRRLHELDLVKASGGGPYLSELSTIGQSITQVGHHVQEIRRTARIRRMQAAALEFIATTNKETSATEEIEAGALGLAASITELSADVDNGPQPLMDVCMSVVDTSTDVRDNPELRKEWVCRTIPSLTGIFGEKRLVIVAARPGQGKSALAVQLMRDLGNPRGAGIGSLEMTDEETGERVVSAITKIDGRRLRSGQISDDEATQAKVDIFNALDGFPLWTWDAAGHTVEQITARIRAMVMRYGLRVFVVDYLQLIRSSAGDNRQEQVAHISRELKLCAKETATCIIALSQLNREVDKRTDKRPLMGDLRESGALEQDADAILMLYCPGYYAQDASDPSMEIIVRKARQGASFGTIQAEFNRPLMTITEDGTRKDEEVF